MRHITSGLSWLLYEQFTNQVSAIYNKRDLNDHMPGHKSAHDHNYYMSVLCPIVCSMNNVLVFALNTYYLNGKYNYYNDNLKKVTNYNQDTCISTKHSLDSNWRYKMLVNAIFFGTSVILNLYTNDMTTSCTVALMTILTIPVINYAINKNFEQKELCEINFKVYPASHPLTMVEIIQRCNSSERMV